MTVRGAVIVLALLAATGCGRDDGLDEEARAAIEAADLAVVGTDGLEWDPPELTAAAGTIEFALTCEGANHDLVIEETGEDVAECRPRETVTGTVELDAGTYTFVCTIPGHEDRMRGTLTVG